MEWMHIKACLAMLEKPFCIQNAKSWAVFQQLKPLKILKNVKKK